MSERPTRINIVNQAAPMGFVYFVTVIGALIYFEQSAIGFWNVVGGFFQALVWPGFVVYHILQFLHA